MASSQAWTGFVPCMGLFSRVVTWAVPSVGTESVGLEPSLIYSVVPTVLYRRFGTCTYVFGGCVPLVLLYLF